MPNASYFFNAISYTKDSDQFTQGEIDKDYKPYTINRMVSQYRELILFADEMNTSHSIEKSHQLAFYMTVIPKRKRRSLWTNKTKDLDLKVVMDYYNITQEKADPYMRILTIEQIKVLRDRLDKGGRE